MQRILTYLLLITCFVLSACQNKTSETNATNAQKIDQNQEKTVEVAKKKKKIIFFGDSLTAGYGLEDGQSFPSLIQQRIDSLNLGYQVINAGLSGETTAGGKGRIDWVLQDTANIFVLELGANDVLRGLELKQTKENLRSILEVVRTKYPNAKLVIVGMQSPPNMGAQYAKTFNTLFPQLAKDYNAALVPFLLDGVAGNPALNLKNGKKE